MSSAKSEYPLWAANFRLRTWSEHCDEELSILHKVRGGCSINSKALAAGQLCAIRISCGHAPSNCGRAVASAAAGFDGSKPETDDWNDDQMLLFEIGLIKKSAYAASKAISMVYSHDDQGLLLLHCTKF